MTLWICRARVRRTWQRYWRIQN